MPSILESCKEYFGTRDLYELLEIPKDSLEKDIKKAYHKISLKVHPDRVPEEQKQVATEKFKVLAKVHQVLTDKNKKALYDEKGIIEDEDEEGSLSTLLEMWQKIFKPITKEDVDNYRKEYVDSEMERNDIKKAYLNGKGCINYISNCVPFIDVQDEPRLIKIVQEMIDANEVPEFKIFTHEPAAKRKRRHQKYAREKVEADKILKQKSKEESMSSLEQQLMKRQESRQSSFASLMDRLVEKYGDEDDEDVVDFDALEAQSKRKKKKKVVKKSAAKTPSKSKERLVLNGKVKKKAAQ